MTITVATMVPSSGETNPWFQECLDSAKGQGLHAIISANDFFEGRRQTYQYGGVIGCLDWDDRIIEGATQACEKAMAETGAGVAFTWQRKIDSQGNTISEDRNTVSMMNLSSVPDSIHHLACIRTEYIPKVIFDIAEKIAPMCIDWIVKSYVALKFGAVQVPMIGYEWRMHEKQASRCYTDDYRKQVPLARGLIRTWIPANLSSLKTFDVWQGLH